MCLYIAEILNPRLEDVLYISTCEFFGCFCKWGWVCIFLPSHTFAYHECGLISGSL